MENFNQIIQKQRDFFNLNETLNISLRKAYLICLQKVLLDEKNSISDALNKDLGKHYMESYMTEIGIILSELSLTISRLDKWAKIQKVKTPLSQFKSKGYIMPEPYGVVLIMSPWNYPFQLSLLPLIGALAAGNTVVLKPSAYSSYSSLCLKKILSKVFPESYVTVVLGGREENANLLNEKFDYIFFTGSPSVGKLVMSKAALNLTPVTLELGGKSPVIVEKTANIKLCAKRVAFGKILNAGQTCVAPDYLLIDKSIKSEFIKYYKEELDINYSEIPHIINIKHFKRLVALINETIKEGGECETDYYTDENNLFISPCVLSNVTFDSTIMKEEIFGPVLPIIEYDYLDDAIDLLKNKPKPLALYLFTTNKKIEKKVLKELSFGGGCVNDTIVHLASSNLGFGGIGDSGMGQYHGKKTFETFTHYKSILKKSNIIDINLRYHPYSKKKYNILKRFI